MVDSGMGKWLCQHPSLAAYAHKRGGGGCIGVSLATLLVGVDCLGLISQPPSLRRVDDAGLKFVD